MVILGIDPGFAAIGYAVVEVFREGDEIKDRLIEAGTIRTEKSDKKRNATASSDNIRRTREIVDAINELLTDRPAMIACEGQSNVRNASSAVKVGYAWGCFVALAHISGIPIEESSPQELKKRVAGSKSASKEEVQAKVSERWPNIETLLSSLTRKDDIPHPYDAAGAIIAAMSSPMYMALRGML